jgi:F-box domain
MGACNSCINAKAVARPQPEKASATSSTSLLTDDVVKHVLEYVGAGHWFSLAAVSKLWREVYAKLPAIEVARMACCLYSEGNFTCDPQMSLCSAVFASPSLVRLAHDWGFNFKRGVCQTAAGAYADIATLKAARKLGMSYRASTMVAAVARPNQFAVLQYLYSEHCPWDSTVCYAAAMRGDLRALRWARARKCPWDVDAVLAAAVESGSVELVTWITQHSAATLTYRHVVAAAQHGRTEMCAYLLSQQCPAVSSAYESAAAGAHLDTLRYLHEHSRAGTSCWSACTSLRVCAAAGQSGSIPVMQYVLQIVHVAEAHTAAVMTGMLCAAGAHGQLAAAQWLKEQCAAEWPAALCFCGELSWSGAALQWAREQGCDSPTVATVDTDARDIYLLAFDDYE